MRTDKKLWISVILISILLLTVFLFFAYRFTFYRSCIADNWNYSSNNDYSELLSLDEIEDHVNDYLDRIDIDLEIGDIFIYEDSDYYMSVEESATGRGAFELLINPYTGVIYPESGPNMMWNEKYGMHARMMGNPFSFNGNSTITKEEAISTASKYVRRNINPNYDVHGDGHEFYGYYTLHIEEDNSTVGMLSVNYYTGEVWFHDWHGTIIEVISHHDDN